MRSASTTARPNTTEQQCLRVQLEMMALAFEFVNITYKTMLVLFSGQGVHAHGYITVMLFTYAFFVVVNFAIMVWVTVNTMSAGRK